MDQPTPNTEGLPTVDTLFEPMAYAMSGQRLIPNHAILSALSRGADIDAPHPLDPHLSTPAMIAIEHDRLSLLRILIARGADLSRSNRNGSTAAHVAVLAGKPQFLALVLEHGAGAGADARDNHGRTPLELARSLLEETQFSFANAKPHGDYLGCMEVAECFCDQRDLQRMLAQHKANPPASRKSKSI